MRWGPAFPSCRSAEILPVRLADRGRPSPSSTRRPAARYPMPVREVGARELAQALAGPERERPLLLDVRNAYEVRVAALPGSMNVPIHELPARLDEIREVAG